MRKIVSLLLAGVLVLSLAGCQNTPSTSSVSSSESEISAEVSAENSVEASVEEKEEIKEEVVEEETIPAYSLKEVFAAHNMKAGTCLTTQMISTPNFEKLILEQFSSATMENDMKPDYILDKAASQAKNELVVSFNDNMIKMLDWAKENGIALRGHTLVWYSQTPSWIFYDNFDASGNLVGREEMLRRMDSYFCQVFEQLTLLGYIDLFYAYDVANECWMEDGSMRDNFWKQTIGEDYLWQAFNMANKYAPESIALFYNDYNEQFKTETLYDFVNTLVDENGDYLIDGIGFQAHLYTEDSLDDYFATMDRLASTGLEIQLTELDVCLGRYMHPGLSTQENLMTQGRFYYDLVNGILERVDNGTLKSNAITFWGFTDALSWRKEYNPCLYNKLYKEKYAFYGAVQAKELAGFEE